MYVTLLSLYAALLTVNTEDSCAHKYIECCYFSFYQSDPCNCLPSFFSVDRPIATVHFQQVMSVLIISVGRHSGSFHLVLLFRLPKAQLNRQALKFK